MSGSTIRMSYAVNGKNHGVAFEVPSDKLENKPLFPHVITKNCRFSCNFGGSAPAFPVIEGYIPVAALGEGQLVTGPKRPAKKQDCEVSLYERVPTIE
jgi:heterogeneous nuclear ribonucleoprotein U-like protein 1